jgi:hypothetical protein
MYKIKNLIILAIILSIGTASAQSIDDNTNGVPGAAVAKAEPPSQFYAGWLLMAQAMAVSTNWALVGGYGHSFSGIGRNIAFGEVGINFNDYVGAVLGNDYLFGAGNHQFNSLSGGMTITLPLHPFAFLGSTILTNILVKPVAFDQVATSSSSTVANLMGIGMDFDVYLISNFSVHAGIDYEKRTGDSRWDGDYGLVHIALSRYF